MRRFWVAGRVATGCSCLPARNNPPSNIFFWKRLTIKTAENMNIGSVAKWMPVSAPYPANTWRTSTLPDRKLEKSWLVPGDPRGNSQIFEQNASICVSLRFPNSWVFVAKLSQIVLGWSCKKHKFLNGIVLFGIFSISLSPKRRVKMGQDG